MSNVSVLNLDAAKSVAAAMGAASSEVQSGGFDGKQLLKLSQDTQEWAYGMEKTPCSTVMVNPASFQRGFVLWEAGSVKEEKMAPLGGEVPMQSDLSAGAVEQWIFDGAADDGAQVRYKVSSMGGCEAVKVLCGLIAQQFNADPEQLVAEIRLEHDSYVNTHGRRITKPVFTLVRWHATNGENVERIEEEPAPEAPTRKRRSRSA